MSLHNRVLKVLLIFLFIISGGTFGYRFIEEWSLIDSFYMAIITVTTVGFSEVRPLSSDGQVFTTFLILLGVGGMTYALSVLTNYFVTGELRGFLGDRKMKKQISSMKNHYIVCGYGRMGYEICLQLSDEGKDFVVADARDSSIEAARSDGHTIYHGDPGLDETLKICGIDRAVGLAAVSDDDANNLMVVISARGINPGLTIVARASSLDAPDKFTRAGADSVVLPYRAGGKTASQLLVRPQLHNFFDDLLHERNTGGLSLESMILPASSRLSGKSLGETEIREKTGAHVIGLIRKSGLTETDLSPLTRILGGDTLIVLGKRSQVQELERILDLGQQS